MLSLLVTLQYVADTKNSIIDRLAGEQKGATAVEYGLLVGLIAVAIIITLGILGPQLNALFERVTDELPAAGTTTP